MRRRMRFGARYHEHEERKKIAGIMCFSPQSSKYELVPSAKKGVDQRTKQALALSPNKAHLNMHLHQLVHKETLKYSLTAVLGGALVQIFAGHTLSGLHSPQGLPPV